MKALSIIPYQLPTVSWSASGTAQTDLRRLPHRLMGRIAHLAGFTFDVADAYTATNPTLTVLQLNNIVNRFEFFDGTQIRFSGRGFNAMRMFERLEHMRKMASEATLHDVGSGETVAFARHLPLGPALFAGAPSDFVLPCAALENGELRYSFGALADIGGGTSASAVITITPTAWLVLLDEIRIPPFVERMEYDTVATDNPISGKCLLACLGAANDTAFGAIAPADFSTVTVETGSGQIIPGVDAEVLSRMYQYLLQTGELNATFGEARSATEDDGPRIVDPASATAIAAGPLDLQPFFVAPPDCQISKLPFVESQLRVRWSGGSVTSPIFVTRILEQTNEMVASMAARVSEKLGVSVKGIKIKTLSKQPYDGPYKGFMPWKASV